MKTWSRSRAINKVRDLGIVLCDKRVKEIEMFSLMTKTLRREVSAIFKYLAGCHMEEGQMCSAWAQTTELALTTDIK